MNTVSRAELEDWSTFIRNDGHILSRAPGLLFQQAANQPTSTAPAAAADRVWKAGRVKRPWIRWVNKPDGRDATLFTLPCSGFWIHECCFTADGSKILTLGQDLQLWNAETGALIANPVPSDWANPNASRFTGTAFALAPDGRTIASDNSTGVPGNAARVNGKVRVWNLETGDTFGILDQDDRILSLAISADGQYLATGTEKLTVRIFDLRTLQELQRFTHANRPTALTYSPCRPLLAVCGGNWNRCYEVALWDVEKGSSIGNLVHNTDVHDCAFSPDGERIVTCAGNALSIWDVSTQCKLLDLVGHTASVYGCDWSSDGELIVSAAADCEVRLWDAATGEARGIASGHTANVLSCAFSPDGRRIVSGDQHNTAIVWATSTIPGSGRARKHTEMRGGNFSDDGTELAVASSGCVELWSARSGETRRTLVGDNGDLYYDCCYSPDGSRLAAASDNGFLVVWDLKTGDRILRMRTSEERMGGLESCCYSPDGRWLASAAPFRLTVLNAKTHRVARVITYVRGIFWCAFSVDSNRILDSQLQAWDIATGEQISRVAPEKSHPLEYSPDQARVLIAKDKKVHVVDSTTGRTLLVIGGQEMGRARYTPDARWITAEAAPDDLVVYNADSAKEVARFAVDGSLWRFATSNTHLACGTRGTTYLLEMCNLSRPVEATAQPTSPLSRFFDVFRSKTKPGPRDLVL